MSRSFIPSRQLVRRFAEEVKIAGRQGLIPSSDARDIANSLTGKSTAIKAELFIPEQVIASTKTQLADLSYARCAKCGRVYNLSENPKLLKSLKCPDCNGPLVPAPLWVISTRRVHKGMGYSGSTRVTPNQGVQLAHSVENYTTIHNPTNRKERAPLSILIRDRSRPISTLEFRYHSGFHEPMGLYHSRIFDYIISLMPTESITKPVSITAFSYRESDCEEISTTAGPLNGVSKILYCKDMEVIQATVAYLAGHPRLKSRDRIPVIDIESDSRFQSTTIKIPVRYIRTCGLVVKVDEDAVKTAVKELGYNEENLWTALHTISHAFLVHLPQITGLEGTDFGEALSAGTNEVAVYDNSLGGLGGIEGVVDHSSYTLIPNYEWSIRSSHECPLACTRACKACLYSDSCFMLNWHLDRRILGKLGW